MAKIFISCQRSDTILLAHCLRYALGAAGHEPFVDTAVIPAGAAFVQLIDHLFATLGEAWNGLIDMCVECPTRCISEKEKQPPMCNDPQYWNERC